MDIKRVVGDNIRGFRNKLGWTQEKLAMRSKLHYNYIGTVERAEDNISITSLYKIAKVLRVQPHFFFIENAYQFSEAEIKALTR
jgi:transcriptional regulator with XRE-family HTH domain